MTKQVVTTKLKAIRQKYRQAVDSGRRSGHGRVVLLYSIVLLYSELCEKVWGGLPATEQLESEIETTYIDNRASNLLPNQPLLLSVNNQNDVQSVKENETGNLSAVSSDDEADGSRKSTFVVALSPSTVRMRRQFLDKKLGEYKQQKLKRKLPVDV